MSIVIDGGRVPKLLSRNNRPHSPSPDVPEAPSVKIALINNMPDAAMEDTELQFFDLLGAAAGDIPVSLKLYSLPRLPRSDAGQQHLSDFYFDIQDLLNGQFDGMIMTGTEPRQPDLRDEPFVFYARKMGPLAFDRMIACCEADGFRPRIVQDTPQWPTALRLIAAGLGVTIAPACVATLAMSDVVFRRLRSTHRTTVNIGFRWDLASPVAGAFLRIIRQQFSIEKSSLEVDARQRYDSK